MHERETAKTRRLRLGGPWAMLLIVGIVAACGSTGGASDGSPGGNDAAAPDDSSGPCASGKVLCGACGSGGFCALGGCPAFTCPRMADDGGSDAIPSGGPCPAGQASCHDCGGGRLCVQGDCSAISCPNDDASAPGDGAVNADASRVSCAGQLCAAGEICCPGCSPGSGSCSQGGCPGFACLGDSGGGSLPCGTQACGANQVCVHGSPGGIAVCLPRDGGSCPSGWTPCGTAGCTPPPPAPFCSDVPAACGGQPTCGCLGADVCRQQGMCTLVNGRNVTCMSA
jgi:hypothetical protein